MNGPLTSATNYALIACRLRSIGVVNVRDWSSLKGAIAGLENAVLLEWLEEEYAKGTDVVLMTNFHLGNGT